VNCDIILRVRPLKKNKLVVTIHKPVARVFEFLLDPAKSPLWVESFVREETSDWPVREGTVYRNLNRDGVWNEYTVTAIESNKLLILRASDGNYHVRYTFAPVSDTQTELEYYEWVIRGVLDKPFTQEVLSKLKNVVEAGV